MRYQRCARLRGHVTREEYVPSLPSHATRVYFARSLHIQPAATTATTNLCHNRIGSKINQEVTVKYSLVLEILTVWKFVVFVFGWLVTLCGNSITAFSLNSCLGLHNVTCSVDHST